MLLRHITTQNRKWFLLKKDFISTRKTKDQCKIHQLICWHGVRKHLIPQSVNQSVPFITIKMSKKGQSHKTASKCNEWKDIKKSDLLLKKLNCPLKRQQQQQKTKKPTLHLSVVCHLLLTLDFNTESLFLFLKLNGSVCFSVMIPKKVLSIIWTVIV